jgi:hypothetical protein
MEGPEYLAFLEEEAQDEYVALMGATTFRLMSGFAAEMPDDPSFVAMTATPKVVFSSTLEAPLSWGNTELIDGDAVAVGQDMKRRDRTFDGRLQLLEYVPTVLDGPPGVGEQP